MMLKHSLHVEGSEDISVNLLDYEDDLSIFGYVLQEECAQFSCINAILQYHVHRQFVCRAAGKIMSSLVFILMQTLFLIKRSTYSNDYSLAEFRLYRSCKQTFQVICFSSVYGSCPRLAFGCYYRQS